MPSLPIRSSFSSRSAAFPGPASAPPSGGDRPLRYALYVRKSTEEDERQTQSIQSQIAQAQDLAARTGREIVLTLEESRSAKEQGRPQFDRMLALIDAGDIDGLLGWHPDRLSRNEMDAAAITMRVRKGVLRDLAFVSYFFHNSPEGIMMLQMALCQSQYMVSKLSKDVKRGIDDKLKKGWYPHRAPLGYVNEKHKDKGDKTISPDPERFPLLREAWDRLLSGAYSVPQIKETLNRDWGMRTPVTRSGRGGQPVSKSTLYRLFSSVFYAGYFVHDGLLYKGAHPPMVSMEEFDRAQTLIGTGTGRSSALNEAILSNLPNMTLLSEGETVPEKRLQPRRRTLPFTGLIRCAGCRDQVTGDIRTKPSGRTYTYYHCQGKGGCPRSSIRQADLEALFDAELSRMDLLPEFYAWAQEDIARSHAKEENERQAVLDQKRRAERDADGMLEALLCMRLRGLITDAEYAAKRTELTFSRERLREDVEGSAAGGDRAQEACVRAADYMKNARCWLREGDAAMKRIVAVNLGSDYRLEGGKLLLEPNPLLVRVQREYPALAAKYEAIGPEETGSVSAKKGALTPIRTVWSGIWQANYTEALERNLTFPKIIAQEAAC